MNSERIDGPTPHGGAYMTAYWKDKNGEPCAKAKAVTCEIVEYDAEDNGIWRTYGDVGEQSVPKNTVHKHAGG